MTGGEDKIKPKRIAVLVSGGVDSAVVVDMLYKAGHDLHLYYIRIGMDNDEGDCTAEEDIEICTLIARRYGLPLKVVSLHEEYWDHVMRYTLDTVARGLTPHPDMMCNKLIKFGFFEQRWGKDFDAVATGHYASIEEIDGVKYLATAVDPVKDQTDFLAQISYDQLKHLMFPLGALPKSEVRRRARELNLPNANRKDSQVIWGLVSAAVHGMSCARMCVTMWCMSPMDMTLRFNTGARYRSKRCIGSAVIPCRRRPLPCLYRLRPAIARIFITARWSAIPKVGLS